MPASLPGPIGIIPVVEPIVISVTPVGTLRQSASYAINGTPCGVLQPEELFRKIVEIRLAVDGNLPVVIKPARDVRWKYAVEAYNQAIRAKCSKISFAHSG